MFETIIVILACSFVIAGFVALYAFARRTLK